MNVTKVEIEINPLKVIWRGKKNMLGLGFWPIWTVLVLMMIVFNVLSHYYNFIQLKLFSPSKFLVPGITGLSFTLALITATTRIFPKEKLTHIYLFSNEDNSEKGELFYRTIAPYIWTSTIWLIVTIGALFSDMFTFSLSTIMSETIKIIFASIVLMGIMSLWSLLITHIKDLSLETEREVNQKNLRDSLKKEDNSRKTPPTK